MFLPDWTYTGDDPGLKLFTLARPQLPAVPEGAELFEIGASDTDVLERIQQARPDLRVGGIDWRPSSRPMVLQGDVLQLKLGKERFAAVLGLSSVEHLGLGRYGDPFGQYGDIETVHKAKGWLTPDGWFYLDVPYTPEGFQVFGTNKCRCYDDAALTARFGPHQVLGYTDLNVSGWIEKPVTNNGGSRPFYYVAILIRRGETNS